MGNFVNRVVNQCFGLVCSRRKYLKTKYNVEGDRSIEFETLMDEESPHSEMSRLLTDREKQLLKSRQFDAIVHEQTKLDMEIDHQLAEKEEELRKEEESYREAKREAARINKLHRAKEKAAQKNATVNGARTWLANDSEWEVAGGEDEFELFLANVKARSVAARAQIHAPLGEETSSLTLHSKERALSDAASLELEWDEADGQ